MSVDKKIITDIKAILLGLFNAGLSLWKSKLKIVKWFAIVLALFLVYRVYKILTVHKTVIQNHVVSKIIHVKKTGYYRLSVYIKPRTSYFRKRQILAHTKGFKPLSQLTVHNYLYAYKTKILPNKKNIDKFENDRYRHLIFRAKITGKGSSPFILFYISLSNPNLPDRIVYTPVNIPVKNVLRNYTALGRFKKNGYIKLTKNPDKKKPVVRLTKSLYLYPKFAIKGKIKYLKAYIEYKIKHKKYFSRYFNLSNGGLINLYGIIKNKKIKRWRDADIIKINFVIKKYKKIKGSVKFINLGLIYPNYLPLKNVFEKFIYKRYFISFMSKSKMLNRMISKKIRQSERNGAFVSAKKIKQALIHKILDKIFFVDYNTKIKHINHIKNKIVRHFYRFVYKKYLTEQNFFSPLLSYFNKPKHFYKNILIPIPSKDVIVKTRKRFNGNKSYYGKKTYIYIYFNKLKFYKYWFANKYILKEILKSYNIKSDNSLELFTLRGSNNDYWYGKYYYRRYPILKSLRVFAFDKKIKKINGFFYKRSLPIKYPKFLRFPSHLYLGKTKKINMISFLNLAPKFGYQNQLSLINSFSANPFNFLENVLLLTKNTKRINIKSSSSSSKFGISDKNDKKLFFKIIKTSFNFYKKIFILKFKTYTGYRYNYGLIKLRTNMNLKNIKKLIINGFLINHNDTKTTKVFLTYYLRKGKMFIIIRHLQSINLMNYNKLVLILNKKNITHQNRFNFQLINNKVYLIKYYLSNISLLDILFNQTLFKLNTKKFSLKGFNVSSQQLNNLFRKGDYWLHKKIFLKKGVYFIKDINPLNSNFTISLISLNKIRK